ncbi:MAG: thioredoxin domain-containing protein [Myxococcota bacterium]
MTQPSQDESGRRANRLADETSAYLRQHKWNPVDWYPWGTPALERAQREDKPLLVSIGYSACHWCHVMERESFEDPAIAEQMNRLFVNVKVDREERPDIDQLYMDSVVRLTGRGGWPLTLFCTPDGRPFYGGTYFPPEPSHGLPSFGQVLDATSDAYRTRRHDVEEKAAQLLAALRHRPRGVAEALPSAESVLRGARALMRNADRQHGGFGDAPKFPTPTTLELLLASLDFLPADEADAVLRHCVFTCHEMSRRGLYDHLAGGFHRYCVDEGWGIPHFEKMLYDQGLLLRVYLETWRRSGALDDELLWPVRETVAFLRREMSDGGRGYYASQDADSEGEEGIFYVWRPEQIEDVLGDRARAFCEAYSVTAEGNFEAGHSHLIDCARAERDHFSSERAALLAVRSKRTRPATDPKRVAAWNGFVLSGLARCASALGDTEALDEATRVADFILEEMRDDEGRLLRVFNQGRAHVTGFLDDHAALLDACLDLHRAGAGQRFLAAAHDLAQACVTRFFDESEGDFFLTPVDGERLTSRPRSEHDGATPHAAGLATLGLLRVAEISGREALRRVATRVIRTHAYVIEAAPEAHPTLLRAVALEARGMQVAVIVGEASDPMTRALAERARRVLAPEDAVLVVAPGEATPAEIADTWLEGRRARDGRPTAYLCRGHSCSAPITEPEALA